MRRHLIVLLALVTLPVFATRADAQTEIGCKPQRPAANRPSPYDSVDIVINGQRGVICYGRPSARGRTMIGGELVPYGKLWRTGANEPTTLHLPYAAIIAGVQVAPGSYSLYTVPGENEWEVVINRSTSQWGHEGRYTDAIKAQEVGRGKVKSSKLSESVEMFTIRSASAANGADLVLEWEKTRVAIPIRVARK